MSGGGGGGRREGEKIGRSRVITKSARSIFFTGLPSTAAPASLAFGGCGAARLAAFSTDEASAGRTATTAAVARSAAVAINTRCMEVTGLVWLNAFNIHIAEFRRHTLPWQEACRSLLSSDQPMAMDCFRRRRALT